jgi:hypothetical protein
MLSPQAQAGSYWARKRNRRSTTLTDDLTAPAWATASFGANPSPGDTATINGTVITFGTTVTIAGSLALTLAATVAYILAHPITGVNVSVSGNGLLVESVTPGDTTPTLAASNATVSSATLVKRRTNQRVPL